MQSVGIVAAEEEIIITGITVIHLVLNTHALVQPAFALRTEDRPAVQSVIGIGGTLIADIVRATFKVPAFHNTITSWLLRIVNVETACKTVLHLFSRVHVLQRAAFALCAGNLPALVPAFRMRRTRLADFRRTFLELPTIHNAVLSVVEHIDRS